MPGQARVMLFWLILLFVTVPLLELALLIWVGGQFGVFATVALVILTGILGATLARIEGLATLRRFQTRLAAGELPHQDLIDGLLILIAGAVLLTPGLLTDTAGFLLLVRPVRAVIRGAIAARLKARFLVVPPVGQAPSSAPPRRPGDDAEVVDAEYTVEESPR